MNPAIASMLNRYKAVTVMDYENALKEIMQEIALLGLWRAKFFEHAAFYGGTALRILYGLDRFSEDLDFSLLQPNQQFSLSSYLNAVRDELGMLGFDVTVDVKGKLIEGAIESAFIKGGTREHLIRIAVPPEVAQTVQRNKLLNIKLEVDTDPPGGFQTEVKPLLQPIPFGVRTYTQPDLFAGKIHAILQRGWKNRVKGRDYYDFVWYVARGVPVRIAHLEQRLRQLGGWNGQRSMNTRDVEQLLRDRFSKVDIAAARQDVIPFLRDPAAVELWSSDFFLALLPKVSFE